MAEFNIEYPFDSTLILLKKKAIKRELLKNKNTIDKKIALLSGSTIGDIKDILELFLLNFGIKPIFYEGSYNNYFSDIMFNNEKLKEFNPDIIYIHTSNKNIDIYPNIRDNKDDIKTLIENENKKYTSMWNKIKSDYNCAIIQNNFELNTVRLLGNRDCYDIHGRNFYINKLNNIFYDYAYENDNFYINDINYLSAWYGLEKWSEPKYWQLYKYCLNVNAIPVLCHNIAKIIKSIYGKNQKGIVVDLDNTLWGGVIGECGVEGIELGKETAQGYSYIEFQQYLKDISNYGISLCIASKNEKENALKGLNHPFSVLKEEDFIYIEANWNNKAENLQNIADKMNITADSIVFVDDNPAEREIVKENLKDIKVVEADNANEFIKYIDQNGYFEITTLSEDDFKRNQYYKKRRKEIESKNTFIDYDLYLKSLDMRAEFSSFNKMHLERITQLINKTNQFNLTTKRYNNSEIEYIINNKDYISIYGRLIDKYGDNGIVTLAFGKKNNDIFNIELWIMSCRVFERKLEFALFDEIVKRCKNDSIKKITGKYIPTSKNKIVCDFYDKLGFNLIKINEDGSKEYIFEINNYIEKNSVIKLI